MEESPENSAQGAEIDQNKDGASSVALDAVCEKEACVSLDKKESLLDGVRAKRGDAAVDDSWDQIPQGFYEGWDRRFFDATDPKTELRRVSSKKPAYKRSGTFDDYEFVQTPLGKEVEPEPYEIITKSFFRHRDALAEAMHDIISLHEMGDCSKTEKQMRESILKINRLISKSSADFEKLRVECWIYYQELNTTRKPNKPYQFPEFREKFLAVGILIVLTVVFLQLLFTERYSAIFEGVCMSIIIYIITRLL